MDTIKPINTSSTMDGIEGIKDESIGVDFSLFTNGGVDLSKENTEAEEIKKRGRPRKKTMSDGNEIVLADGDKKKGEEPFIDSYSETNNMLRGSIIQIDSFSNDLREQFDLIKQSKTLKKKYDYISEIAGTSSSLLSTKITAIREMNNTITKSHELEMKRFQALKAQDNAQDDDQTMMRMYQAFVNTPIGAAPGQIISPSISDMTTGTGMASNDIVFASSSDNSGPLSPEQLRMRMEANPNIQEFVVYNKGTGAKYFDWIDSTTNQSVQNMPRTSDFLLDDTTINLNAGTARNANINKTWPLMVVGEGDILDY